jgi:hypothetical protein
MEGQSKQIINETKEFRSLSSMEIRSISKEIRSQQKKEMEGEPKESISKSNEILIKQ